LLIRWDLGFWPGRNSRLFLQEDIPERASPERLKGEESCLKCIRTLTLTLSLVRERASEKTEARNVQTPERLVFVFEFQARAGIFNPNRR
jgi:hypothetical protein